jgi:L-fuconolactonase
MATRLIDAQCHVGERWFEPVEALLFQMERSGVDQAVLVQGVRDFDNAYLMGCLERYPGRFAAVVTVDSTRGDALATLERLASDGASGVRVSLVRALSEPGFAAAGDLVPLARGAGALGMTVSCYGRLEDFLAPEFETLISQAPDVPIAIEHLGYPDPTEPAPFPRFMKVLAFARSRAVSIKLHGFGEWLPGYRRVVEAAGRFDPTAVPPFVDMAIDAFGAHRVMIATDWPTCSAREGYANVLRDLGQVLRRRSAEERRAVLGGTAAAHFGLGPR